MKYILDETCPRAGLTVPADLWSSDFRTFRLTISQDDVKVDICVTETNVLLNK